MPRLVRQLRKRVFEFVGNFLRAVRNTVTNETRGSSSASRFASRVRLNTIRGQNRGAVTATGKFHPLGTTPFDSETRIPEDGIKPVKGKALRLEKPEGVVFRSRTYTKFAGQTVERTGFFSEALRENFSRERPGGIVLVSTFLGKFAQGVVSVAGGYFRRAGFRVRRR